MYFLSTRLTSSDDTCSRPLLNSSWSTLCHKHSAQWTTHRTDWLHASITTSRHAQSVPVAIRLSGCRTFEKRPRTRVRMASTAWRRRPHGWWPRKRMNIHSRLYYLYHWRSAMALNSLLTDLGVSADGSNLCSINPSWGWGQGNLVAKPQDLCTCPGHKTCVRYDYKDPQALARTYKH
jgi:hypothetical protein